MCHFPLSLQSHAGKVVLRGWYERNKHIFPASRWEPYDPERKWDKYTVRTRNVNSHYLIHVCCYIYRLQTKRRRRHKAMKMEHYWLSELLKTMLFFFIMYIINTYTRVYLLCKYFMQLYINGKKYCIFFYHTRSLILIYIPQKCIHVVYTLIWAHISFRVRVTCTCVHFWSAASPICTYRIDVTQYTVYNCQTIEVWARGVWWCKDRSW